MRLPVASSFRRRTLRAWRPFLHEGHGLVIVTRHPPEPGSLGAMERAGPGIEAIRRLPLMALTYGILLPQGWTMDLMGITDPTQAYEAMTLVAQTADELGFASAWLVDHFHTIPQPSQEVTFECWTTTAALAR